MPRDHVASASGVNALWTFVGFFARVSPLMSAEMIRAAEDLIAGFAGVGFDPGVKPHVPGEHVGASEAAFANLAAISLGGSVLGALSSMSGSHVFREAIMKTEHLSTDRTDVCDVRTGWHFLDDRRNLEIVTFGDGFFGCRGGDVTSDDGNANGASGDVSRRE